MRALIQRVSEASVSVEGRVIGEIGRGMVLLTGIRQGDPHVAAEFLADKIVNLRIFDDDDGKLNLSALDIGAEILVISQFTLYGDCRRGRRPGFSDAAPPEFSKPFFDRFVVLLEQSGLKIVQGRFGASMQVKIFNDGPVTLMLDSEEKIPRP
ncbi:D-tyrosyl-tRNA(Tyr) deacylase [candidate division KSB1 bacterium]|nr:D-tyrosyl-tRNA(Tyr) deacylase [candidate division KSB1 bacterium]